MSLKESTFAEMLLLVGHVLMKNVLVLCTKLVVTCVSEVFVVVAVAVAVVVAVSPFP